MKIVRFGSRIATAALLIAGVAASQKAQTTPNINEIRVPGKASIARVWSEKEADGSLSHFYTLSLDGKTFTEPIKTDYDLRLRFERFDPTVDRPEVPDLLRASEGNRLMIVQYWTQGIEDYRETIRELGGEVHMFLANHSNVVEMDLATLRDVRELPFVRSVTPFHPAFKLEEELLESIAARQQGEVSVNVLTTRRYGHDPVIAWVESNGGTVEHVERETYFMTVKVRYDQLPGLAGLDAVQWIDRWSAGEEDVNIAKAFHGAEYAAQPENGGYTGTGVRIEVLDGGCVTNHPDLQNFLIHNQNTASSHGTSTAGIVFSSGSTNPLGTGFCPDGTLIIADYGTSYAGGSRYTHTGQLRNTTLAYKCVAQTNSWGNSRTTAYTSNSQQMDQMLFDFARLSIFQSQSNSGGTPSRPQAWAKNVIAVGGLSHFNTWNYRDDLWTSASTGPAADGRIKPDLASFYDAILTTSSSGGYSGGFGGTSGATPIVAGTAGIFYEAWADNAFGTNPGGGTPFASSPWNTTAKAMLINGSIQWALTSRNNRFRQGWGWPHLRNLLSNKSKLMIIDESVLLTNLQTATFNYNAIGGDKRFRATLVYRDNPGTTSSTLHRINNLDLKVTTPSGTVYWGNNGLVNNEFSTPGGSASNVDTVENVWLLNPEAGNYTIEVIATEVNQDTHVQTPEVDVDFALVVKTSSLL